MLETALERHGVWMRWHRMGLSDQRTPGHVLRNELGDRQARQPHAHPARSYSNISNVSQSGPAHAPRREIHVFE
jgi:hypothetical protein